MLHCYVYMISNNQTLVGEYFELTKQYQSQYGQQTIVLMQVGAFFEIYGLKHNKSGDIFASAIQDFCQLCQLNISEKKIYVGKDAVLMAGFRDYSLEKYLPRITEGGFTAVVYIQEKDGKNQVSRKLDAIYSPGTYVSYDTDALPQITNHIMCIWVEKRQNRLIYGATTVNIFTGESFLFEHDCVFNMNPTTFDELERFVSIYQPSELLFISPLSTKENEKMIQYSGIRTHTVHHINSYETQNEKVLNCEKQIYISHLISTFFGEDSYNICREFSEYAIATQSFCYLLNFIQEHNPHLVRKMSLPVFSNTSNRVVLANHTLLQLNIIDDYVVGSGKPHGNLSSVLSFLNKTVTAMGKRKLHYHLTHPTFDEIWLQNEYNHMRQVLERSSENVQDFLYSVRKSLNGVRDMEKNGRQLVLKKLYPNSLYHWYQSLLYIQQIDEELQNNYGELNHYLIDFLESSREPRYIQQTCRAVLQFLHENLNMEACKTCSSIQMFEENIIQPGISSVLDEKITTKGTSLRIFHDIREFFVQMLKTQIKDTDVSDYIKIHETEKSGMTLQITKKRALFLKEAIKDQIKKSKVLVEREGYHFSLEEIKFVAATSSNEEIMFPLLNSTVQTLCRITDSINKTISEVYLEVLNKMEMLWYLELENLGKYVAKLDVFQAKIYAAQNYNYCCPILDTSEKPSFVNIKEVRHVLIEHINKNEIYVTNDLCLGGDVDTQPVGMLLYGTNAVGKTSLIRAVGIAVIMAQAGMFVPCTEFVYKPYRAIFSRILSNDNLFKGLSTFVVEMSELRVILKQADQYSLILGDELASGTETESALSIFTSALVGLYEKGASHMFATHFHEITSFEEIQGLKRLFFCHLSVYYDREHDCLVYDRKLKEGSGSRTYGLEVCSSLMMPQEFIDLAFEIRNKYYPVTQGGLSQPTTRYNAKKIRGFCEICKTELGTEIHHLMPQQSADENGFIRTFHKNHPANLASVCEKCHDKLHGESTKDVNVTVRKKTTKGPKIINKTTQ